MATSAVGIDIGGTNIRAARISQDGKILQRARLASSSDPAIVLARIGELIGMVDIPEDVEAIGIGVPGQVDFDAQRVLSGGYVDLSGSALREELETHFGRRVVIDNDCSMALVGEARCGAAKGVRDVAMLTIGTGIGGAVMAGGRIFRGSGVAGQLGHVVVDASGLPCKCGRRGCVETVSSGTALGLHIASAGLSPATSADELLARRDAGDPVATQVLECWGSPLRAAIGAIVATVAPQIVVVGGGLGVAAVRAMSDDPEPSPWFRYAVVPAQLGDDAGVIGAALAALSATRRRSKRLVLVNGVPASGKSLVAAALAESTGWPLLSLDTIKNPFLEEIGKVDRPFNRRLGRASLKSMFALLREAPEGAAFIMDAWFGFQPIEDLSELIHRAGVGQIAEFWCEAPPEVVGERYRARASSRLPGHPGVEYVPELVALAEKAAPTSLGPVHRIDTTRPMDITAARTFLDDTLR